MTDSLLIKNEQGERTDIAWDGVTFGGHSWKIYMSRVFQLTSSTDPSVLSCSICYT